MLRIAYKLWRLTQRNKLGGWLPIPPLLRRVIVRYPRPKQIHTYARLLLGQDLSYLVRNEVGCSESVSRILMELGIVPRIMTGTYTLFEYLNTSGTFIKVQTPQAGDIVISPTGMGNGKIQGHVGIMDKNNRILSNDSASGKFSSNYSVATWNIRYKVSGGLPVYYFRAL